MSTTCFVCGDRAAIALGGVSLCRLHGAAVREEIDRLRAEGRSVDVSRIASRMRGPEPAESIRTTPDAVHAYLHRHGITGSQAARMMYLSGSRQVRKYTGGEAPRQMDGARWFCLHAHQMLTPEQIGEIEAAMEADSRPTPGG